MKAGARRFDPERARPAARGPGHVVAVVGPPGSGKSTLSQALAQHLRARGCDVAVIGDARPELGRATHIPQADLATQRLMQQWLMAWQMRRALRAARHHDWVIADGTALELALQWVQRHGDTTLIPTAMEDRQLPALTLVLAGTPAGAADAGQARQDVPCVLTLLRGALMDGGWPHCVLQGDAGECLQQAKSVWEHWRSRAERGSEVVDPVAVAAEACAQGGQACEWKCSECALPSGEQDWLCRLRRWRQQGAILHDHRL